MKVVYILFALALIKAMVDVTIFFCIVRVFGK